MNEVSKQAYGAVVPGMDAIRREPEVGTVLVYKVEHEIGSTTTRTYYYASIRAGDGRWYTTGRTAEQGVDWVTLYDALRASGAQVWTATGWSVFEL